ncbi:hypothetical protein TWF730_002724 [Orbilia blumenaviensis]|uniref:Uncharacterized protein n=1 Tax=Orbilia blumenaviensis TaxID=1796055 RepID=A0AAV9UAF4_9PEZI
MGFPWNRSGSIKSLGSSAPPADARTKRRSSSFLRFGERKGKQSNAINAANGSHADSEEDEAKPSMLQRAASSMLPDHMAKRPEIESMLSDFANVLKASLRPLPSPDRRYEKEPEPSSGFFKDLKTFGIGDIRTLREVIQQRATGDLIDDKTYITERIIQLAADLPTGSRNRVAVTNDVGYVTPMSQPRPLYSLNSHGLTLPACSSSLWTVYGTFITIPQRPT